MASRADGLAGEVGENGLHLGGRQPLIVLQCTGLFEAGDALRNLIHDLKLPLFFVVGVRSELADAYRDKLTALLY